MNLFDLTEEVVESLSPSQICNMDVDLLELEDVPPNDHSYAESAG